VSTTTVRNPRALATKTAEVRATNPFNPPSGQLSFLDFIGSPRFRKTLMLRASVLGRRYERQPGWLRQNVRHNPSRVKSARDSFQIFEEAGGARGVDEPELNRSLAATTSSIKIIDGS